MALIQASRPPGAGGGGGGLTITGWRNDQFAQVSNFTANSVTLTLTSAMVDIHALVLDYNGQVLHLDVDYTVMNVNHILISFADPYVTSYDTPPVFQAIYPY